MSYLTLKANDASIVSTFTPNWEEISGDGMYYRAVGATEWTNAIRKTAITVDTVGIELKADTIGTSYNYHFSMTGSISASGDITSLTNGVGGDCTLNDKCYCRMFDGCVALTTTPAFPATTLSINCYDCMFYNCTSLTTVPVLPATTMVDRCYYGMFAGCTSLTVAPVLPATVMAIECYSGMFFQCSSLTAAPELPATALAESCYELMFYQCSSLTTAPELPAAILANKCYKEMFIYCTSLSAISALSATTLAEGCYQKMFAGCTSLIGYTTSEPDYTLIHNYPSTTALDWNTDMYSGINAISTVPATPSSGVNYYFKPATPPISVEGKILSCIGSYN